VIVIVALTRISVDTVSDKEQNFLAEVVSHDGCIVPRRKTRALMLRVAAEYDCAWPIKQRFLNFKMSQIKSLDSLRTFVIENEDEKQKNIREPRGDCSHVSTENYNYEDASLSCGTRCMSDSLQPGAACISDCLA
jgi:hypothetical protein